MSIQRYPALGPALLCAALLAVGCAALPSGTPDSRWPISPLAEPGPGTPFVSPLQISTQTPKPVKPSIAAPLAPRDAAAAAIADLANRLGIDAAEIAVVGTYADEFPAQGLGCPFPGQAPGVEAPARPARVTGQVIYLRTGDAEYEYHARGSQIAFCGVRRTAP